MPLDQPLVLTFSAELAAPARPSWVRVQRADGSSCEGLELETRGRLLLIHPRLPLLPDLSDAGLPPGANLELRLAGVPRLQALAGEGGERLIGDRVLPIRSLGPDDPAAMSGFPAESGSLRVLDRPEAGPLRLDPARSGSARLRFSSALDPRGLAEPAWLEPEPARAEDGNAQRLRVPLRLTANAPDGATLELDLGDWTGRGLLTLPDALEGLGGNPLVEDSRRFRIVRGP